MVCLFFESRSKAHRSAATRAEHATTKASMRILPLIHETAARLNPDIRLFIFGSLAPVFQGFGWT